MGKGKKKVLSRDWKTATEGAEVTRSGRLFHIGWISKSELLATELKECLPCFYQMHYMTSAAVST